MAFYNPQGSSSKSKVGILKSAQFERLRLFVGLDFGTTYTGIAYCLSSDPSLSSISVLTQWPGAEANAANEKTPTEICYQPGKPPLWGYEAEGAVGERTAKNPIYGRFKLSLDPTSGQTSFVSGLASMSIDGGNKAATAELPPGKSALQVTTDYLTPLYAFVMQFLRKRIGGSGNSELLDSTPIDWIMTVPAIWNHKAQEATRTAARNAGFGSRAFDKIRMVSEPEAAALYSLTEIHESIGDKQINIEIGQDFVVCDAGGGTVDLITYAIESVTPVLRFRETVVGGGAKCGSTYIDAAFHAFLRRKLGRDFDNEKKWTPRRKGRCSPLMKRWDVRKRTFGTPGAADKWYAPLPGDNDDNKAIGLLDNELEVTKEDMAAMFDPVVDQVINLVQEQVNKTREAKPNGTIATVLLVGGFGESNYLYKRMKVWAMLQNPPLSVQNPKNSWSAVVRGAVMHAIAPKSVTSRKLRMHYGVKMNTKFIAGLHDEEDAFNDVFIGKLTRDNVNWIAALGEDASADRHISIPASFTFGPNEKLNQKSVILMGCSSVVAPKSVKSYAVTGIGKIVCDFNTVDESLFDEKWVNRKRHTQCCFTLDMEIASGEAIFKVLINGSEHGSACISLDE